MATTTFRSIFKVIQNSFPLRWVAWDRRFEVWGLGYFRLGFADLRLGAKNSGQVFTILVWASKNWRWGSRILVRLPGFRCGFCNQNQHITVQPKLFRAFIGIAWFEHLWNSFQNPKNYNPIPKFRSAFSNFALGLALACLGFEVLEAGRGNLYQ